MSKRVFIAEKPSVAREFAGALHERFTRGDGYMESEQSIVTWCFGHLVTLSYPDSYDPRYHRWALDDIPFIPEDYRYEVIGQSHTKKQFRIVRKILTSREVDTIYICTDSGREGEYIYRLVARQAGVTGKRQLRVWIDSFTESEILRGIREARDDSDYDHIAASAALRSQEDYLMGINFTRALSLRYAGGIRDFLGMDHCVIAVGRVMTCVLGMVVRREREIRSFVRTPFYRVAGSFSRSAVPDEGSGPGQTPDKEGMLDAEWSVQEKSRYFGSPILYRDNGFRVRGDAQTLADTLLSDGAQPRVLDVIHKKERKNPPLLYNLAELQNDCSRLFRMSPDQTLAAAQTLYERKLTTYPRTDARVLSTAIAGEIGKNLKGIGALSEYRDLVRSVAEGGRWKTIGRTRYTNDSVITDHYAIIPTGEGLGALRSLEPSLRGVYDLIVRRFLSIFFPAAVYARTTVRIGMESGQYSEVFSASWKRIEEQGYLVCLKRRSAEEETGQTPVRRDGEGACMALSLKKGDRLFLSGMNVREGETTPPKRYTGGSLILAMENAGQFIEDESLREQIRGSGIGTSATRAAILEKLVDNQYLGLQAKTQIYTPTQLGEMIYDTVDVSLRPLLDPKLTASWEKGLSQVAEGTVTEEEYRRKLNDYVIRRTNAIKESDHREELEERYRRDAQYYPKAMKFRAGHTRRRKKA